MATFDDTQGQLQVTPPEPLVANDSYVISWPALRGIDTATLGSSEVVHFTAGSGADTAAPEFEGLTHISWDVRRERDTCTDDIENRFSFDLTPGTATDDFGTASLAIVVFQTKGPNIGVTDPPLQVTVAPFPGSDGHRPRRTLDQRRHRKRLLRGAGPRSHGARVARRRQGSLREDDSAAVLLRVPPRIVRRTTRARSSSNRRSGARSRFRSWRDAVIVGPRERRVPVPLRHSARALFAFRDHVLAGVSNEARRSTGRHRVDVAVPRRRRESDLLGRRRSTRLLARSAGRRDHRGPPTTDAAARALVARVAVLRAAPREPAWTVHATRRRSSATARTGQGAFSVTHACRTTASGNARTSRASSCAAARRALPACHLERAARTSRADRGTAPARRPANGSAWIQARIFRTASPAACVATSSPRTASHASAISIRPRTASRIRAIECTRVSAA